MQGGQISDLDMIDLMEIVQDLLQVKKDERKAPLVVSMKEIQQEVAGKVVEELRRLYKEGKVKYHETLNGHAFSIKE